MKKRTKRLNIYGEPLKSCRRKNNNYDLNGSWNKYGYCDETDGGVHQICVNVDNTNNFSLNTGQSDWSNNRKGKNHCMCLGAWSLYKAKQDNNIIPYTNNELNCESIMDISFNNNYINKWNTWNGNELPNQIVNGVNHIMNQCYFKANKKQKKYLKKKYKKLTKRRKKFHKSRTYKKIFNKI